MRRRRVSPEQTVQFLAVQVAERHQIVADPAPVLELPLESVRQFLLREPILSDEPFTQQLLDHRDIPLRPFAWSR
jgi:hypothetical protein